MVKSQDLEAASRPLRTSRCLHRKQVLRKVNPNDFIDVEDTSLKQSNPYAFFTTTISVITLPTAHAQGEAVEATAT